MTKRRIAAPALFTCANDWVCLRANARPLVRAKTQAKAGAEGMPCLPDAHLCE